MIVSTEEKTDPLPDRKVFQDLLKRANEGEADAQEQIREILGSNPDLSRKAGDLGQHAMDHLIRIIVGKDVMLRQAVEAEAEALLEGLAGPQPSRPREMLAKHVVCCWLQVRHLELASPELDDDKMVRFKRWQREATHRYEQAIKLLHDLAKIEQRQAKALRNSPRLSLAD